MTKFDSLSIRLIKNFLEKKGEEVDHSDLTLPLKTIAQVKKHMEKWDGEMPKEKIEQVVNVWETGSKEGDYSNVTILPDGPGGKLQITYGRSQTTSTSYLKKLIEIYIKNKGKYAGNLEPYLNDIEVPPYLVNHTKFINFLKLAGKEDPVMKKSQDELFDMKYWKVAFRFFEKEMFTFPLSMLTIYDSYVHGGLSIVRNMFPEATPANHGDELQWLESYLKCRYSWLANNQRKILHTTKKRSELYLTLLWDKNYDLSKPFEVDGVKFS